MKKRKPSRTRSKLERSSFSEAAGKLLEPYVRPELRIGVAQALSSDFTDLLLTVKNSNWLSMPPRGFLIATRYDSDRRDFGVDDATIVLLLIRSDDSFAAELENELSTDNFGQQVGATSSRLNTRTESGGSDGPTVIDLKCDVFGTFRVELSTLPAESPTLRYYRAAEGFEPRRAFDVYSPNVLGLKLMMICLGEMLGGIRLNEFPLDD